MGSIDVMLSWLSQKNIALVQINNIISNGILIVFTNGNRNLTQIRYLDMWALLDSANVVGMLMRLCLQFQVIYKCFRDDILAALIVNDQIADLILDRIP